MVKVARKNSNPSLNHNQGIFSRIGSRVLRIIIIIFSPITYLFNSIYNFLFGATKESKREEALNKLKKDIKKLDDSKESVVTQEMLEEERVNRLREGWRAELNKIQDGEEGVITEEVLKAGMGLHITIDGQALLLNKRIKYICEDHVLEMKLTHEGNEDITVNKETTDNNNEIIHRSARTITKEDRESGKGLIYIPINQKNIYETKAFIQESLDELVTFTFEKIKDTNNIKIKKTVVAIS